jgi:hypothetical protein
MMGKDVRDAYLVALVAVQKWQRRLGVIWISLASVKPPRFSPLPSTTESSGQARG